MMDAGFYPLWLSELTGGGSGAWMPRRVQPLPDDLAALPRAKKAYHYNTMPCLSIRHALLSPSLTSLPVPKNCKVCFNLGSLT